MMTYGAQSIDNVYGPEINIDLIVGLNEMNIESSWSDETTFIQE